MNTTWIKPPAPESIKAALTQGLAKAVFLTAVAAGTLFATSQVVAGTEVWTAPEAPQVADTHADAATLAAAHGCWTGQAPADMEGVIPGHVVVVRDGEATYGGARLVGKALAQVFDGADHGLTVYAFCR